MTYSDVVNRGLILPKKQKYTKRDVDRVLFDGLFSGCTLSPKQSAFIVKCSAIYWGTDYSKTVANT